MLPYYAARFTTVEVNYTFYRLPSEKTLDGWLAATPEGFAFTLKASRRITHDARLKDCEELLNVFCERARRLDPKLGVLLFQLPPWLRKDLPLLEAFLDLLPADLRDGLRVPPQVLAFGRCLREPEGQQRRPLHKG